MSFNVIVSAGTYVISQGQIDFGDVVSATGKIVVSANGLAEDTRVASGGTLDVLSGGLVDGTTILNGGLEYDTGVAQGTLISAGGRQDVGSGSLSGQALGTTIDGGLQLISSGVAEGVTIGGGGNQTIGAGGTALEVIVGNGEQDDYGLASNTTVDSGSLQYVYGAASGTVLQGGTQHVFGDAENTTINSGGVEFLYGHANNTVVNNGGVQCDFGFDGNFGETGAVGGAVVNSGGLQRVEVGGQTDAVVVMSGGVQDVYGQPNDTTVSGGAEYVENGGLDSNAVIKSGLQVLRVGGSAQGVAVSSGGEQDLLGDNTTNNETIHGGGVQLIEGGQLISHENNLTNSGTVEVLNAVLGMSGSNHNSGTIVVIGGGLQVLGTLAGGITELGGVGGFVEFGSATGESFRFLGGASGASLVLDVASAYSGGIAAFGGAPGQFIELSSVTSDSSVHLSFTPHIKIGGTLTVTSGGHTVATLAMLGHYTSANFHLNNLSGHVIVTDPRVVEQPTGNAAATITADTTLEVKVPDSGKVTFAAATGTLLLDNAATFTGAVAGLSGADAIDLAGIAFGAHTTLGFVENKSGTRGTLSISDGKHTAKIALFGNYIAGSFALSADAYGGTLVTAAGSGAAAHLVTPISHP